VILHKFWSAFVAQVNKIANIFWEADPVAQMRYEYDRAVEQLKEGRTGLEQYRGLVERVTRQVAANRSHVQKLEAQTKAYLKAGDRATATRQLKALLDGYERFHPFNREELGLIESLRTLRLIHYAAWIGRRWEDPAFPAAFPWFGTGRYWQDRILELREQTAAMDEPPLSP